MNAYFTPRTPEPRSRAAWIVIGTMLCGVVALAIAGGVWMGIESSGDRQSPDTILPAGSAQARTNVDGTMPSG